MTSKVKYGVGENGIFLKVLDVCLLYQKDDGHNFIYFCKAQDIGNSLEKKDLKSIEYLRCWSASKLTDFTKILG